MSEISYQDLLALDTENRSKALNPARSFMIEAPAGAGKTELLTQRFLALLACVNEPEEIVALTFTNKAAAEMRHRIVSSLHMACAGNKPEATHRQHTYQLGLRVLERDKQRQWGLLEHAGRLQVTTLDALCGKLARQMPLLSRFGSQPGIAVDAEPYYSAAAQSTLQLLEEDIAGAASIERVLAYFDNNTRKFQTLVVAMLARRDQWMRHASIDINIHDAEWALTSLIESELANITVSITPALQAQLMPVARFVATQALLSRQAGEPLADFDALGLLESWQTPLQPGMAHLPHWLALSRLLLTNGGSIRKQIPSALGLSGKEGKPLLPQFKETLAVLRAAGCDHTLAGIRALPSAHYDQAETTFINDLVTVLKLATAQLWLAFKEAHEVDFTQITQNALTALGDDSHPADLQLQLDYRISHLLVDEFQDTSPTQVELLKKITSGWQPGDGRTLFLVGDPMQSIYRFRKADVGLFLKVRQHGLGQVQLEPLSLYRNNRSYATIVNWVNLCFPQVFASKDDHYRGAIKFKPAKATQGDHALAQVQFHPIIEQGRADDDSDEALCTPVDQREAQHVVRLIRQAQAEDPAGSIAVLVRARSHLGALVEALRLQQPCIRFQAVEIEPLAHRQVIQDLMSLTYALHHQADRVQWLACLRAPWCGLKLADLHALAANDHAATVWSLMLDDARVRLLSADGQRRLLHVRAVFAQAFAHQGRQRPRRWVEGVWHALGGPLCLSGASDLLDARAYLAVLDTLETQGYLDLGRLEAEVKQLFAAPDPDASAGVQLMTMHKSKGLEFDTVILPSLHRKGRAEDKNLLLWDAVADEQGGEHLIIAHLAAGKTAEQGMPSKFDFLHQFETVRAENELQRLLYVAVTRAKRQLHLVGIARLETQASDSWVKSPPQGSLLSLLWHVAHAEFEHAARQPMTADPSPGTDAPAMDTARYRHHLVRLAEPGIPEALQYPLPDAHQTSAAHSAAEQATGQQARDVGTLVHRYLEMMALDRLENWDESRINGLCAAMTAWFQAQGYRLESARQAVTEVQHNLITTLASPEGRWVLSQQEQAGCEVPFTRCDQHQCSLHIVDRTFVADGVRWVVDYKSTPIAADASPSDNSALLDEHLAQLERYAALFASDMPVKIAILFTHQGKLVATLN